MSVHHDTPAGPPVAHATAANRRASRLAGVALVLFMACAWLSNAWWSAQHDVLPEDVSLSRLLEGGVTHDLSERLADMTFSSEAARLQRGLGWLMLRDLGPRVRQGCAGWLFLADELQPHPDADKNQAERARIVVATRDALAARGIELLVAVVPDKSRIEADRLCGLHRSASFQDRYARWLDVMRAESVRTVDLNAALSAVEQQAYYRNDSHWTEGGAGAAARAVAGQVRASGVGLQAPQQWEVSALPAAERPGDLVRLAGVDWLPLAWQPQPEKVVQHRYTPAAAAAAKVADDLFGDSALPSLALVGTSFSRTSEFLPQLSRELGVTVGNFARDGGKFGGAAQAYFKSPAWKQSPPRMVIWEMDERDLGAPLTDEDRVKP
ncbi:alginate O-acetyltransferase AlgX-related protein [Bordetella genomosp. 12]|uniref:Cell division protein FtsQ n=1 Tax=Bordetella genomosp. 12 TaxID=463035 RepID=A0A261VAK0_9BORD|nr:cell division protein FtsQ [Bordetella genomosp. 12]OZI70837.1 cell division protein FtsQ [Bordetella genomosp. 12]